MATEIKLPRLGQGMESGTITKWLKSEGDEVKKGEPLYELDTDKVTQEVEADASGVLLKIAVREGEVEVGRTIAVIGQPGESVAEADASATNGGGEAKAKAVAADEAGDSAERPALAPAREPERERGRAASTSTDGGRIKASPLARRIARERGIELSQITGT